MAEVSRQDLKVLAVIQISYIYIICIYIIYNI